MTAVPILLLLAVCPAAQPDCPAPTVYPPLEAAAPGGCAGARPVLDRWEDARPWAVVVAAMCRDGEDA